MYRLIIIDVNKIPAQYIGKPIFIDGSIFRAAFNAYISKTKRKPGASFGMFKKVLEDAVAFLPKDFELETVIDIGVKQDSFIEALIFFTRSKSDEVLPLLNKLGVVFTTPNNFFYRGTYNNIGDKARVLSLLTKITRLAHNPNETTDGDLVQIVSDKDLQDSDKELLSQTKTLVTDDNDKEHIEIDPSIIHSEDEDTANHNDRKTVVGDDIQGDTLASKKAEEDLNAEEQPIELDTLLSMNGGNLEKERLDKENKEFFDKVMHQQVKALSKLEEEADKLASDKSLTVELIPDSNIISDGMKSVSTSSITTNYYNKQFKRDMLNTVKSLNSDPEFPVIVNKFEVKDNSTALAKTDELTIEFLDKKFKKHTFKVDVPRLSHDGFLYFGGNKKFIAKQATLLPVIKETHDRVQITTNYRKTFLYRKGEKTSGQVDRILRLILNNEFASIKKAYGNSISSNSKFDVSIPYNFLAKKLYKININGKNGVEIALNQEKIKSILAEMGVENTNKELAPIGFYLAEGKPFAVIFENLTNGAVVSAPVSKLGQLTKRSDSFIQFLTDTVLSTQDAEVAEAYKNTKPSLSLSYTEIKIVSTSMALGALVAAYKGLIPALDLYKVKYRLEEKRVAKKESEIILAFKDVYLYIDTQYKQDIEIFVNGLLFLNTTNYNIGETTTFAPIYLDYLEDATGSRNNAKALLNFESSMIDPITMEILQELKLPTNFPELLLYGNTLLGDFTHSRKNDMSHFRIRDSEVIAVAVYNELMKSFNDYKRGQRSGITQPLTTRKDSVTKAIQNMPNVEDFSTLSPFLEAEVKSKATFKGPSGLNSSDAYTSEIRAYDKSMLGLYGIYTPIGPEVGVNRSLVMNPKYTTTRGFMKKFDIDSANASNLFSIGEMLNVFTPKHADSPRAIMATVQGKHTIPTKQQESYIVGNGSDKALPYIVGNDYAFKASQNGKVTSIDTKKELCIITFDDGNTSVIDFSKKAAKNSGGGFYTENKLTLLKKVKVGYKFKKNEILAIDDNFFKEMLDGSVGYAAGKLAKVAVGALPETFEDSCVITDKLVDAMSSTVINTREVVLSKNSRIISMAKEGDDVKVNDSLIIFEEVGDDESAALAALEKLDKGTKASIESLARSTASAKYTGKVHSIRIYYNCELEDMHPTLREMVASYIKKYNSKATIISKAKDEIIQQPSTNKIESDKILGNDADGVVIQFFIEHQDKMKVGDKVSFAIALKAICCETIDEGFEPYSETNLSNKDIENVDALISPLSLVSRMVPDFYLLGYSTKVVLSLEQQCLALLEE